MKSYRDYLKKRQIDPVVIQRTKKRKGDKVLVSWAKPVLEVA